MVVVVVVALVVVVRIRGAILTIAVRIRRQRPASRPPAGPPERVWDTEVGKVMARTFGLEAGVRPASASASAPGDLVHITRCIAQSGGLAYVQKTLDVGSAARTPRRRRAVGSARGAPRGEHSDVGCAVTA